MSDIAATEEVDRIRDLFQAAMFALDNWAAVRWKLLDDALLSHAKTIDAARKLVRECPTQELREELEALVRERGKALEAEAGL